MVDKKQIRRRRAVLALLVAAALILLTAYFGESPSSPLHAIQRGVVEVFSPIQEGASKALKPVRDIAGWFSDTFHARSQVQQLRKENQQLVGEIAALKGAQLENAQLSREVGLDNSLGINAYHPVAAQVIARDPTLWYATVEVDKGSADGISAGDPVLGDGALVGTITTVSANVSIVTLITDHNSSVTARIEDSTGDTGVLVPAVGAPNQLLVQYIINRHAQIQVGQPVVTAGFRSGPLESLYPANIPIGQVSSADPNTLLSDGQITVTPDADLRHFDAVQILTAPHANSIRAQVP